MINRNIKVVDEHAIDRNANVMFAIDVEGSEYVAYWIDRDEVSNNVLVSKVIKNIDNTFNLLDIEDPNERAKVADIVRALIKKSVSDENDKLNSDSLTLSDGKVIKFITVSFNKEQRINVLKTYVNTVKKEVTKVSETYYDVVAVPEVTKTEDVIFPSISPVTSDVKEEPNTVAASSTISLEPSKEASLVVEPAPVLPTPAVEVPKDNNDSFVAFGSESTIPKVSEPVPAVSVQPSVVESTPVAGSVVEPITTPVQDTPAVETPATNVVESVPVTEPVVLPSTPTAVVAEKIEEVPSVSVESQPLVFNAAKETNLNAALGEVANSTAIPVEDIKPVREFGVEEPVKQEVPQQVVAPMVQPEGSTDAKVLTKKAGFANNKFFMVVAIAFFLASCVFLGYEVFNYFQLTK